MTEIQKVEEEIKVLQKKLEFLQSIRDHKEQEIKEAYKVAYGRYPETGFAMSDGDVISWDAFKKGYVAGQQNELKLHKDANKIINNTGMINCFVDGNPPNRCSSWSKWYELFGSKGILQGLRLSSIDTKDEPYCPDEPPEYDEIEHDIKDNPKTLFETIYDWKYNCADPTCEELVDRISGWLPASYEFYGAHGRGWNDCLNQIKEKLK